jgi:ferrous iron transport protein A
MPSEFPTPRLSDLEPGAQAVVVGFHGELEPLKRLREMGLVNGTRVKFLRWAPLGDPLEIELRGYRLSLRKHDAEQIEVRPIQPPVAS